MGEQQSDGNDGDKSHQPQHDPATDGEFFRDNIEDVIERADSRQLGAAAYARQLHHRADHAGSHKKENFGGAHVIIGAP